MRQKVPAAARRLLVALAPVAAGLGAAAAPSSAPAAGAIDYGSAATVSTTAPTVFTSTPSDQPVVDLAIHEIVAGAVEAPPAPDNFVCVALSAGASFANTTSQPPSVTSSAGNVGAAAVSGSDLAFPVSSASTTPATYTLSGLYVTGKAGAYGPVSATVTEGQNSGCSLSSGTVRLDSSTSLFGVEASSQDDYGTTAEATTASEFSSAVNCSDAHPAKNTAVVATDLDPYDALSAATLEGALAAAGSPAGLLITPQATAGPDLLSALKADGVGTVYVVGGPDAVSPSVVAALKATGATSCSGSATVATSNDLDVVGPIYGTTADDTSVAIDDQAASLVAFGHGLPKPAASFNDTAGTTTGSWAAGGSTAILVADTDWSDSMAVSGLAYKLELPVVLTPGTGLGSAADGELHHLAVKNVLVLGGQLALQDAVVSTLGAEGYAVARIAGSDATDSAQLLARYELTATSAGGVNWSSSGHSVLLAQGAYWSDALGAAVVASTEDAPIFLTEGPGAGLGGFTPGGLTAAATLGAYDLQVLGGPDAVPPSEVSAALSALAS